MIHGGWEIICCSAFLSCVRHFSPLSPLSPLFPPFSVSYSYFILYVYRFCLSLTLLCLCVYRCAFSNVVMAEGSCFGAL